MSHTICDCGVTLHAKHEANVGAGGAVLLVKFIENLFRTANPLVQRLNPATKQPLRLAAVMGLAT